MFSVVLPVGHNTGVRLETEEQENCDSGTFSLFLEPNTQPEHHCNGAAVLPVKPSKSTFLGSYSTVKWRFSDLKSAIELNAQQRQYSTVRQSGSLIRGVTEACGRLRLRGHNGGCVLTYRYDDNAAIMVISPGSPGEATQRVIVPA